MNFPKIIFWSAVTIGALFGIRYLIKGASASDPQKLADEEAKKAQADPTPENVAWAKSAQQTADAAKVVPSGFPLQVGSRGDLVKKLQSAMVKYYGKGDVKKVLPRYGVDGIFGSETKKAVMTNMGGDGKVTVIMYNVLLDAATKA